MTTATQPAGQSEVRAGLKPARTGRSAEKSNPGTSRHALPARVRNALFAEWAKFSPTLDWECSEREARIRFANEVLRRGGFQTRPHIESWTQLSTGEAKRLLREMKERSGSNAAYRALLIGKIALRLFGSGWEPIVMERCRQRFLTPDTRNLTPDQAHSLMEELLSRLAREESREIEELRREMKKQMRKSEVGSRKSGEERSPEVPA